MTCSGGVCRGGKGGEGPDIWLRQWPSYTCISGATGLAHYCYSHSRRPATFDLSSDHNLFSHFRHAPRPSVRLSRWSTKNAQDRCVGMEAWTMMGWCMGQRARTGDTWPLIWQQVYFGNKLCEVKTLWDVEPICDTGVNLDDILYLFWEKTGVAHSSLSRVYWVWQDRRNKSIFW